MANQDVNGDKKINAITVSVNNNMTKSVFQDKIDMVFDERRSCFLGGEFVVEIIL